MASYVPTQAGFLAFVRGVMGISSSVLPDDSDAITLAYLVSIEIVNLALSQVSPLIYQLAVYNLAGDNLVNFAQDVPDAPPVKGSDLPYFEALRAQFNTNGFVSGVISSAGDEGTNESMVVQEAAKNFTLADLQNLKTPWGRQYLAYAQRYGTLWGST